MSRDSRLGVALGAAGAATYPSYGEEICSTRVTSRYGGRLLDQSVADEKRAVSYSFGMPA
jgi:hypothetical protein